MAPRILNARAFDILTPIRSWVHAVIGGLIGFIIIDTVIIVVYALFLFTPYPYWILQFLHLIDR